MGFKYLLVYTTPAVVLFSILTGGWWSFFAVGFLFGFLPLVELFTPGVTRNLDPPEEQRALANPMYDVVLYGLLPAQYLLLYFFLEAVSAEGISWLDRIGAVTAFGMSCGVLGINAAHELGHRKTKTEQFMSKALLLTSLYMHFFIEHNRGHHVHVSTREDPASGRYGEHVYAFFIRSIAGSWWSAWQLEKTRLEGRGLSAMNWRNEMLQYQAVQLGFLILIGWLFGWVVMVCFMCSALIGILMLEAVNYIEHYGLERRKSGERYERVMPVHSWNSNHSLGRLLLLELSRHSDHHYQSSRKYQVLRHFDESPQMPTGYPGMMLLSLIPPVWFRTMNSRIERLGLREALSQR